MPIFLSFSPKLRGESASSARYVANDSLEEGQKPVPHRSEQDHNIAGALQVMGINRELSDSERFVFELKIKLCHWCLMIHIQLPRRTETSSSQIRTEPKCKQAALTRHEIYGGGVRFRKVRCQMKSMLCHACSNDTYSVLVTMN